MLCIHTHAYAEQTVTGGGLLEVIDLQLTERTKRGRLDACELNYTVAFQDYIYKKGELSVIRGSLSYAAFIETDKSPGTILKVTSFAFIGDKLVPDKLDYAFLKVANETFAGKETTIFTCDDGGICLVYDQIKYPSTLNIDSGFDIGIVREGGGTDVIVPFNVMDIKFPVYQKLLTCRVKLYEAILEKLEKLEK